MRERARELERERVSVKVRERERERERSAIVEVRDHAVLTKDLPLQSLPICRRERETVSE